MTWTHTPDWKLPASPERVFRALTDPAELTQWFAERADVGSEPGGPYRFWGRHTLGAPSETEARQTITSFEPGRALGFSWRLCWIDTAVHLTLAPENDATRLTLTHTVVGDLIRDALARHRGRRVRVASIGSGPAREVEALLASEPELGARLDVALIDQEERAIAHCERRLAPLAAATGAPLAHPRGPPRPSRATAWP